MAVQEREPSVRREGEGAHPCDADRLRAPRAHVEEENLRPGRKRQLPAVGRPGQRSRPSVRRRDPANAAAIGVDHGHAAVRRHVGEDVPVGGGGLPDRRDGGSGRQPDVAGAVTADDVQAARSQVRDARVRARAAPAREADPRPGERPVDGAARREGGELVRGRGDDVEPVRRPRRLRVVAEPPFRAIRRDDPGTALARDEHASAGRQAEQRRLGVLDPDRAADGVHDRAAGLREGGGGQRCDRAAREYEPHPLPRLRARLALRVGGVDDLPGAGLRLLVDGRGVQQPPYAPFAHSGSSRSTVSSRSRPRRSRELTVPRGRSSSSAISPGVYSSR